jgi:cytochrome c peroxidase
MKVKPCLLAAMLAFPTFTASAADSALRDTAARLFGLVEVAPPVQRDAPVARLGRALFWDERLSANGRTSCASCHAADAGGADRRAKSIDAHGKPTPRNAQTVFNALRQPMLRWLGDRPDAAAMAEGLALAVLGFRSGDDVVTALAQAGYGERFRAAFPGEAAPLTLKNYGRAIAAYQATLTTPAPFDRFLSGDDRALTPRQQAGLRRFIDTGCAGCHSGPVLGGTMFQRFGIVRNYAEATESNPIDPGRFAITGKEEDRHVFRVAMLRNVAKTGPYFHDGSVATLPEAVRVMAAVQHGRTLNETEVVEIVAFLESLSGGVPAHYAPPR